MNNPDSPVLVLKQKFVDIISDAAPRAEKDGKFTRAQLNVINDQNWFRIYTPASYGGLQMPLPDSLRLVEALAHADGSAGWAVTRSALAGWVTAFANTGATEPESEKVLITGTYEATGTAEKTKSGYTINGSWTHVAMASEAGLFAISCKVTQNGIPVKDDANKEQVISLLLDPDEVTIQTSGNLPGLAGTGSTDITVKNLKVPAARAFRTSGDQARVTARLFQYPLLQLTEAALAMNISGMAFHFIDECRELLAQMKGSDGAPLLQDNMVDDTFEKYTQRMNDARTKLFYAVDLTWQSCVNQQPIKETMLYKVSAAAQDLTRRARECVDALYPFCGTAAMDRSTMINRIWRDLHTASHDPLLVFGAI